uniref:Beta-ketoacyl-acyl-carrier-protein synthase I n=1 Tax=Sphingobacterium sp. (strain 21) TaxID=743722 RepID=F4CBT9_SPHS2
MIRSKIISTGAYIPTDKIPNGYFLSNTFFDADGTLIEQPTEMVILRFKAITGIEERRYAPQGITASDMGALAAKEAIIKAEVDPESIDQIIVAHNYGDMRYLGAPRDMVPSVASKIKHKLGIRNTSCTPYDIIFGCPGWLQALIQADLSIRVGAASTCLVIGTENLSRVLDYTDRDSMIFSDGAGACILLRNREDDSGIINSLVRSDTCDEIDYIFSGGTNNGTEKEPRFIKMHGRKVYEYALKHVPPAMKECFDRSGERISNLKMVFLHQANEKMDEAIIKRFYALYGIDKLPENIMPLNIALMGNSSVATIPTLLHQVLKGEFGSFQLERGDIIMLASVGAGMNINAITYKW